MKEKKQQVNQHDSSGITEKLDLPQIVLRHIVDIGNFTLQSDPTDIKNTIAYIDSVGHLESMMGTMKDEKFESAMKEHKETLDKVLADIEEEMKTHPEYPCHTGVVQRFKNKMMSARKRYFEHMFTELNKLASRCGIGWTKQDVGDFQGYHEFLRTGEAPTQPQKYYGMLVMQEIHAAVHKEGRNQLIMFIGQTGTGKSLSAISVAQMIDPTFNLDRVVFSEKELITLINKGLPKGAAIVCDESGLWFAARDFSTETNKLLSSLVQTFRNRNLFLFWTLPLRRQLDVHARLLSHVEVETVALWKDVKPGRCLVKLKFIKPSFTGMGRDLFPHPQYNTQDGVVKITRCLIPKPTDEFEREYEKKKDEWQNKTYETMELAINKAEAKSKMMKEPLKKEMIIKYIREGHKMTDIAKRLGVSYRYVQVVKSNTRI